jgi:exosortase family protein XrtF
MLSSFFRTPLYRFLFNVLVFYILWYLVYELWLHPGDIVDLWVVRETMNTARHILDILGYTTFGSDVRLIGIDGTPGLWMGDNCDSIELCAIFTGFIIAFPGMWKHKLWYIPIGCVLITLINVLRIVTLAIIQLHYSRKWLDFNHTYTFTILVYGFIFFLWLFWVNKIAKKGNIFKAPKKN